MFKNNKQKKQQHISAGHFINAFFLVFMLGNSSLIQADILDAAISTGQGETRIIDLTNNVTDVSQAVITIASQPSNGTAEAVDCPRTGTSLCVSYTPANEYTGLDSFTISVVNDDNIIETATVSVNVNQAVIARSGSVPDEAIRGTLDEICGSTQSTEVDNLCQGFNAINATSGEVPEDLRELIDALTPQDVAAQETTASALASQQLENIGKHLAALRRGQKNIAFNGLTFRTRNRNISFGDLFGNYLSNNNEDVAQNVFGTKWGWFVNGSVGGGKQDETAFENGFDFDSDGISLGADFRIGNSGIIGTALGIGNTQLDFNHDQGGMETRAVSAILFGSFYLSSKAYIDLIASYNRNEFDATRRIVFGETDDFSYSNNKSRTTALNISGGFEVAHIKGFTATLNGSAEYMNSNIDGYVESGDSPFNVTVAGRTSERVSFTFGGTMTYAVSLSKAVLLPQFDIDLVHRVNSDSEVIEGYFSDDPNKSPFTFNSNEPDENYLRIKLGLSSVFTGGHSAFVQLGTTAMQDDFQNWNASVGYRAEL